MVEDPDAGSGSHGSLLFYGPPEVRPVRVVLVYGRVVSPGVQRGMLRHVRARAENTTVAIPDRELAARVIDLLEDCFAS